MTMSSILVPTGLLEVILHSNGTTELVESAPICEDYSNCEDTVDLPPEPEQQEITSVPHPPPPASKGIFFDINLGFKPLFPELSRVISSSYGDRPPHKEHYHWETSLEDWNNYWSTQWTNHWRNHWMNHRNKFNHWKRKLVNPRSNINPYWNTRRPHWNTRHHLF